MTFAYHDAHNHLQDEWLAPHLDKIADQLTALPLSAAVVNGTCEDDWARVSELSRRFPWVVPSFGLHPWDAGNRSPDWLEKFSAVLAAHPKAGVGEIGLDRWILERARPDDPRLAGLRRAPLDEQIDVLNAQLELAAKDNRAATIHCLDAWGALDKVLRRAKLPTRGFLLHAYSGPTEMVRGFAERGAYFSFNGSFLDEKKTRHRDTFKNIPRDRLLVETDAPAMPLPQPWRTYKLPPSPTGQPINHPGNIEAAYAGLAAVLDLSVEALAAQVEVNFTRFFGR
ncbi:MAG: TatD family hydrolase [Verrucomicrobia bacterium]|nr:TatD family hydrolase [Verrucomicrobiota bacterium]